MTGRRFVVSGKVQGVGFRFHALSAAESLGIVGEVWNRSDGCVEAVAYHNDPSVLDAFRERLQTGPGLVKAVIESPVSDLNYQTFRIGHSRP